MLGHDEMQMVKRLDERTFQYLNAEISRRSKSVGAAYALWFFFGLLGVHKFYLSKHFSGVVYLISTVAVWITFFRVSFAYTTGEEWLILVFLVAALVVSIGWLIDLFTLPGQVERANRLIKMQLLEQLSPADESGGSDDEGK